MGRPVSAEAFLLTLVNSAVEITTSVLKSLYIALVLLAQTYRSNPASTHDLMAGFSLISINEFVVSRGLEVSLYN